MDASTDSKDQEEEIEALASIYGSEFTLLAPDRFELRLHLDNVPHPLILRCCIPERYPSTVPPVFELEAEWLIEASESAVSAHLGAIAESNIGQVVIFLWADWIQNNAVELITTLGLFNSAQANADVSCNTGRHDSGLSDDYSLEDCDPAAGCNVVGQTECVGSDDVLCLMKLDHMRQVLRRALAPCVSSPPPPPPAGHLYRLLSALFTSALRSPPPHRQLLVPRHRRRGTVQRSGGGPTTSASAAAYTSRQPGRHCAPAPPLRRSPARLRPEAARAAPGVRERAEWRGGGRGGGRRSVCVGGGGRR
jgi:hypothetical protein